MSYTNVGLTLPNILLSKESCTDEGSATAQATFHKDYPFIKKYR